MVRVSGVGCMVRVGAWVISTLQIEVRTACNIAISFGSSANIDIRVGDSISIVVVGSIGVGFGISIEWAGGGSEVPEALQRAGGQALQRAGGRGQVLSSSRDHVDGRDGAGRAAALTAEEGRAEEGRGVFVLSVAPLLLPLYPLYVLAHT